LRADLKRLRRSSDSGRTPVVAEATVLEKPGRRKAALAVVVIIILGAVAIWYFSFRQVPVTTDVEGAPKTIAVLPFDNLSPDPDQEYFADGLSEEILNTIAQIPDLIVIARTSSFSFKGKNKTIQEIANTLNVEHILEGSIRKAGTAIRITAQLIKTDDDSHLWSKTYDKEFKVEEMFSVQEDIAKSVAEELKVSLGIGKSSKQLGSTDNPEAYELYLVARGAFNDGFFDLKSIEDAISLDPEFAMAWALKGMMQVELTRTSPSNQSSIFSNSALEAALKAIELEPDLGKAYLTLGSAHMMRGEFLKSEKAYRRGIELVTESIDYFEYGLTYQYAVVGYFKKCNEILKEALQKDPLKPLLRSSYLLNLGILGNMKQAEEEYKRGREIFTKTQWFIGDSRITLLRLGEQKDILSIRDIPEIPSSLYTLLKRYIQSPEAGLAELRRGYAIDNLSGKTLEAIAILAAYFDDPEFAVKAMERSVALSSLSLYYYWSPLFHEARQLPQFKELVRDIGLVDYWKEYGWPDICRPIGEDDFECD
jgi:TolB-like protein